MDYKKLLGKFSPRMTQEEAEIAQDIARSMGKSGDEALDEASLLAKEEDDATAALRKAINSDVYDYQEGINNKMPSIQSVAPDVPPLTIIDEASPTDVTKSMMAPDMNYSNIPDNIDGLTPSDKYKLYQDRFKKGAMIAGAGVAGTAAMLPSGTPKIVTTSNDVADTEPSVPVVPPQMASATDALPKMTGQKPANPIDSLIRRLEAQKAQQPANEMGVIDFGDNTASSVAELKNQQDIANERLMTARLSSAADQLGSAIAGVKPGDQSFYEGLAKDADRPVKQYLDRQSQEKEDPNSSISQGYRNLMKQFGVEVKGKASASDLEKIYPQIQRAYEARENRDARKEMAQLRREEMAANKETTQKYKQDTQNNQFIYNASNKLLKHAEGMQKLRRAESLIDEAVANPSGINDVSALYQVISALDPESVVREGEIGLARQTSGLWGKLSLLISQISTNPKLITKKSLKDMQSLIGQLKDVGESEYNKRRDVFFKQASSRGVSEDRFGEIDPYFSEKKEMKASTGDPKINEYAKQYKLDYNSAKQLLMKRGYKPNE